MLFIEVKFSYDTINHIPDKFSKLDLLRKKF